MRVYVVLLTTSKVTADSGSLIKTTGKEIDLNISGLNEFHAGMKRLKNKRAHIHREEAILTVQHTKTTFVYL